MQEELVSFETAKLAKEKGFNIPAIQYYTPEGYCTESADYMTERYAESNWNDGQGSYPTKAEDVSCSAPTQSLLQKWLREVHKIFVFIEPTLGENNQEFAVYATDNNQEDLNLKLGYESSYHVKTYEEALEKGLQEALNLIPTILFQDEINAFLKEQFYETWMDDNDWLMFLEALETESGISVQSLSNDLQVGLKNGHSIEKQFESIRTVLKK